MFQSPMLYKKPTKKCLLGEITNRPNKLPNSTTEKSQYFLTKYGTENIKIVPDITILNRHQCFHLNSGVNPDKYKRESPGDKHEWLLTLQCENIAGLVYHGSSAESCFSFIQGDRGASGPT